MDQSGAKSNERSELQPLDDAGQLRVRSDDVGQLGIQNMGKKSMNVFTESKVNITKDWRKETLDSILYTGTAEAPVKLALASQEQILDLSSSTPRIRRTIAGKFILIIEKPIELSEVRCSLCGKRIFQYPCWYHIIKYKVNHLACVICFDKDSADKPSTKCFRRV